LAIKVDNVTVNNAVKPAPDKIVKISPDSVA
jgi:hypothetical protein